MTASGTLAASPTRLQRLRGFLEHDPANLQLLAAAAAAAADEGDLKAAGQLLERYEVLAPLSPALVNLKGLAAISDQRFAEAAVLFEDLLAGEGAAPALKFNLAWCRAMLGDHAAALELLDEEVIALVPRAASLKVQALHHLGRPEDALAEGTSLADRYPDDLALMGALATAALDAEDMEAARRYAERAGDGPEGRSILGLLALGEGDVAGSSQLFDQAISAEPGNARALIGKGLGLLAQGQPAAAADLLEQGAGVFGDHLGSWVAVGWARFAQGDYAASRATFDKALALDDTFAESHGALAVLDIIAGDLESAARRSDVALRLDRQCLSAALAKSLIAASGGDAERAERIRNLALGQPIGPGGETLAQAMARFAATGRP